MKTIGYNLILVTLALLAVVVSYVWFVEYSVIAFIFLGYSALEAFLGLHDAIVWRKVDTQEEVAHGNMAVAVVAAARYVAFAIIAAAALMGVPKAAGATPAVVEAARQYVGQKETSGSNRSAVIDKWNLRYGAALGSPYCATAVSAWLDEARAVYPRYRGARSRGFVVKESVALPRAKWIDLSGWLLIFERRGGGHVCVVESGSTLVKTIEPNTSPGSAGSQWNGGEVRIRVRDLRKLSSCFNVFRATHITHVRYV